MNGARAPIFQLPFEQRLSEGKPGTGTGNGAGAGKGKGVVGGMNGRPTIPRSVAVDSAALNVAGRRDGGIPLPAGNAPNG